jgi:integrase/recombinase XerD
MHPLEQIGAELLAWRAGRGESPQTLLCVRNNLRLFQRWLREHYGVETADRLARRHVQAYQTHLVARRTRKGMPMRPGSVNNRIKAVRSLFAFMKLRGYHPADLRLDIGYVKEPNILPTSVLDHAQVRRLLHGIATTTPEGWRDRAIIELLYSSGVRAGELLQLTLDDVDLENGMIKVHGKGNKERMAPIGRTARRCLENYIRAVRPFRPGSQAQRAVFLNRLGRPLNWYLLNKIVHTHAAGIDVRVTCHTFRRSCTTELIRNDANLYHVKELLGHSSLETLQPYTKLTIADLRKTHAKCHPRERDELAERGG